MTAGNVQISDGSGPSARFAVFDSKTIWPAAVVLGMALQAALIFLHRPWVDEWQALQIALETPTLASLFENLRYEGHPPLWYLLLRALGTVVSAQWILPVAAALLAAVAQSIILLKSPFQRSERLMIALGAVMMFEFMTVARGTTLGVTLVFAGLTLMRSRCVWFIIALLPLVEFMFGVISIIFIVLLLRDRRLWWPGLLLWLACSVLAAWSVMPAPDFVPVNQLTGLVFDGAGWLVRLGVMLVPLQMANGGLQWESFLPLSLGFVAGPLFLWFAYEQTKHDRWHLAMLCGFLALSFLFSVAVYPQHVRHLTVIPLVLYMLKWRDAEVAQGDGRLFQLWLAVGAICGLIVASVNLTRPFDQAHLAAKFITDNKLEDKHWLVYPENRAQGISALTGIGFERIGQNCTQRFIRWNARTDFTTIVALDAYLRSAVARRGRFYFLTDFRVTLPTKGLAQEVAAFTGSYRGQDYYISVVGADQRERKINLPACVPGLRPPASRR